MSTTVAGLPMRIKRRMRWELGRFAKSRFSRSVTRKLVTFRWSRSMLNAIYRRLSPSQRCLYHQAFAKMFRDTPARGSNGTWTIDFRGKRVTMPLRSDQYWLDWDSAVSIVGHDVEIKQTYEALLDSPSPPELFVDVGGNYGLHSLLFLVQGIRTITLEPNSSCHDYFRRVCDLNGVIPDLRPIAIGATRGEIELSYPERETWLGSTDAEVVKQLTRTHAMVTERVGIETLDSILSGAGSGRILVKIDTEGHELAVLRGAERTLRDLKPWIVFECWNASDRVAMFELFSNFGYGLYHLPWSPGIRAEALRRDQFTEARATNFIAKPVGETD